MEVIGRITVGVLVVAAVVAVLIGVQSVPDVQRYLKMRRM
ncbi:hypothetical protein MPRF_48290 [Mycolicibacterium parafortuitum]|uniref:Uncharacterized protein n=1 Tax=Mycolicibacterium parafortuitum TaxID=39692 RepID=A0A7I7U9T5_MYCPF|nr:hypothetical protein MPRF_48290 [Mycolicibacterium parafortuitum]